MPRYKELSVINLWNYIKDLQEFNKYFPDYQENEYPERDFLIAVISKVNPEALKQLIDEARESRAVNNTEETNNLIELTPGIKEAILSSHPQKSKWCLKGIITLTLATRGIANYLLKAKAKLRRTRRNGIERKARLDLLIEAGELHREMKEQTTSRFQNTQESFDEEEEEKENNNF